MRHLVQTQTAELAVELQHTDPPRSSAETALVRVEAFGLNRADVLYLKSPRADGAWASTVSEPLSALLATDRDRRRELARSCTCPKAARGLSRSQSIGRGWCRYPRQWIRRPRRHCRWRAWLPCG